MEEVCERENCKRALKRVKANKGSPGVDGMTVHDLPGYLKQHWPAIREQLLNGTYKPQPVRRVEIPKPDGGVRKLGIPTVLDRFIQQAVMQVLQGRWDRTFSDHSYGFRPGRSAHQAVAKAQQYIAEGYRWVVDLDLEKFFDRVSHDKLMARIATGAQGKPAEGPEKHGYPGSTAMGAEVPGIQFHGESGAKAADRAESGTSIQRESAGTDATDAGCECGENGRGVGPISSRLDRLFRSKPDALGVGGP
jgi:RNA-directed DNA polymerase